MLMASARSPKKLIEITMLQGKYRVGTVVNSGTLYKFTFACDLSGSVCSLCVLLFLAGNYNVTEINRYVKQFPRPSGSTLLYSIISSGAN